MKIFVTGSTGFIGSNFLNKAISSGAQVYALRRDLSSKPRVGLEKEPIWIDCQLDEVPKDVLKDIDVLVHLAAHSMYPPYDTLESCLYYNLMAPLDLLNKAIDVGVKRFIITGSCFEYGESGERYDFIPSTAPLRPTVSYAASKAAATTAFYQLAKEKEVKLSIYRLFHVYGEGESQNRLWPSLKFAAENDLDFPMTFGEQIRDFIHVKEVAQKLLDTCTEENLVAGNPVIENLGTGKPMSIRQFSEFWWKKWNAKGKLLFGEIPYRDGEVMRYVPNIENKR